MNQFESSVMTMNSLHSSQTPQPLLALRDVSKRYQTPSGPVTVLDKILLDIHAGDYLAIVGKSGSGKSTLLNMLTAIDKPTLGSIHSHDGRALEQLSENEAAIWRGRHVGIVFQFFQLIPTLSVLDNIMLPMDFINTLAKHKRKQRALSLLEQVGLLEHSHKYPSALSGGQQQRVAIARALANDPALLVADEPTGNLDSETGEAIISLFKSLAEQGKTLIVVTHEDPEILHCSRVIKLCDGKIIQ